MLRAFSALLLSAVISFSNDSHAAVPVKTAADLPVLEWFQHPAFSSISLSPDGKHIAMIVPKSDRSGLAIFAIDGMKPVLNTVQRKDEYLADVTWVSNERLVLEHGRRFDGEDQPWPTGELSALNYDGKRASYLFGYRGAESVGSNIKTGRAEMSAAYLASDRVTDSRYVMTFVRPFEADRNRAPKWCRTDVYTGKTLCEMGLPDQGNLTGWLADGEELRVVTLEDAEGINRMFYRASKEEAWKLVKDEGENGELTTPAGWVGTGSEFYVYLSKDRGPTGLAKFNPVDKKLTSVVTPAYASVGEVLMGIDRRVPTAVLLGGGRGSIKPLKAGPELNLLRELGPLFPGEVIYPVQYSDDGSVALVIMHSDVSPVHYFLYRAQDKKLVALGSARQNLNPDLMAPTEVISSKSRDGLVLESFLTLPVGASEKAPAPLLVIPHGGPFNVSDDWYFNRETQLFASRGYAVLRINFRGSGGYGKQFITAGYKEWGKAMQNDLLDVSMEVLKRRDLDGKRVAIFGASYGGYAALMGGVQSPDFYKAVISMVGVTDLPLMYTRGDIEDTVYGIKFLERSLGREDLKALSPVYNAEKIKAPVMLIHGELDKRVPIVHAARMRDALKKAGNAPEWYVEKKEGHGFYVPENNEAMYTKVLAFLDKHVKNAAVK